MLIEELLHETTFLSCLHVFGRHLETAQKQMIVDPSRLRKIQLIVDGPRFEEVLYFPNRVRASRISLSKHGLVQRMEGMSEHL